MSGTCMLSYDCMQIQCLHCIVSTHAYYYTCSNLLALRTCAGLFYLAHQCTNCASCTRLLRAVMRIEAALLATLLVFSHIICRGCNSSSRNSAAYHFCSFFCFDCWVSPTFLFRLYLFWFSTQFSKWTMSNCSYMYFWTRKNMITMGFTKYFFNVTLSRCLHLAKSSRSPDQPVPALICFRWRSLRMQGYLRLSYVLLILPNVISIIMCYHYLLSKYRSSTSSSNLSFAFFISLAFIASSKDCWTRSTT